MKGLLDMVSSPEGQGLLSAAFGGLAQRRFRDVQMKGLEAQMAKQVAQDKWRAGLGDVLTPKPHEIDQFTGTTELRSPSQEVVQKYMLDPASPFADKILEHKLIPKPAEAFTLSPGQTRYGADGRQVASVPEQQKRTNLEEMLDAAGIKDPGVRQRFILEALKKQTTHAPAANTNVVLKQEGEEAKAVGKFFGDAYANIQNAGFSAQSKVSRYNRLGELLEGVNTGKFSAAGLEVAKAGQSLGFNIDPNIGNKEAAQALASEIALELRNPSGGAGMPGAMSDKDREFLVSMVPGLATTPQGRKQMLETAQKLAQRDVQVSKIAREYRKRNGTIDEGFYDELARYSEQNPLFKPSTPAQAPAAGGFTIRRVR
ncbi:MAG: hypothetical protein EOP84_29100 [Verrucomicrobiaceae bacterium]|nr:MAG: hypothetical protein EOP84_29100 [Verrucomicrobiaceae bacterium]